MNFTPTKRIAPTASIKPASTNTDSLIGMDKQAVAQACAQKVMKLEGTSGAKTRVDTGALFLNMVTPKLFAEDTKTGILHAIPAMYANFDNLEGSVAVGLAGALSSSLLNESKIPELQYYFKLIDSHTKATIATDMPEREQVEASNDLPDFLKPTLSLVPSADEYTPDPKVCAWLYIYAEQKGVPVRVGYQAIESRFAKQVNVVRTLAASGAHIQADVVPQAKVATWFASQELASALETSLETPAMDIADFGTAAQA